MSKTLNLKISGMTCVNCSNAVSKVTKKIKGVQDADVSYTSASGTFTLDDDLDEKKVIEKIKKLGYGVSFDESEFEKQKEQDFKSMQKRFLVAFVCTAFLMMVEYFFLHVKGSHFAMFALASITQFYSGLYFYIHAYSALKNKNSDMNVLVALGTSSAYLYSLSAFLFPNLFPQELNYMYFGGSSMIITFILFGKLLEEKSKQRATDYLKKLIDLSPKTSTVIDEQGNEQEVLTSTLKLNDIILVKAGQRLSSDGVIIEGEAEIDTSMLSGESMPVFKKVGDEVNAGTYNQTGVLKVKVTKLFFQTTLSQIVDLLKTSASSKMPIARLADKVANIFVPSVVAIAFITFFVWLSLGNGFLNASLAAVCVLIISCPCALGLATPISLVSALSNGAKNSILVKNPQILEIIKDAKYVIFDKTGTLTKGEIEVKDAIYEDEDCLKMMAILAKKSEHPISLAVYKYAQDLNLHVKNSDVNFKLHVGLGVEGEVEGKNILIGSLEFLKSHNVQMSKKYEDFANIAYEKGGVVYGSIDGQLKAVFALEDTIKSKSKQTIQAVKNMGLIPIMITGDNKKTAKLVADELGINKFYAQMLPQEKYEKIKELQKDKKVIFVGDGINDSPSLKQADIGISLSSGSDIAKEAGDIILINNDIQGVIKAIKLSHKAIKNIKENLFWAFFYNIIGIPIAAGVLYPSFGILLSPMYAGLAMSFSSVMVVLNALRLRGAKI